jgi:putative transcriptional regulator
MAKRTTGPKKLNKLKEILDAHGKSQTWLAAQLDMDTETIYRYCANYRQPTLPTLFEIARIMNIRPRELLND